MIWGNRAYLLLQGQRIRFKQPESFRRSNRVVSFAFCFGMCRNQSCCGRPLMSNSVRRTGKMLCHCRGLSWKSYIGSSSHVSTSWSEQRRPKRWHRAVMRTDSSGSSEAMTKPSSIEHKTVACNTNTKSRTATPVTNSHNCRRNEIRVKIQQDKTLFEVIHLCAVR